MTERLTKQERDELRGILAIAVSLAGPQPEITALLDECDALEARLTAYRDAGYIVDDEGVVWGPSPILAEVNKTRFLRIEAERDRLRNEVVELRGHVACDFEPVEVKFGERQRWRCSRCNKDTDVPTHAYFAPCGAEQKPNP